MESSEKHGGIIRRLDQLNEFDRQPVSEDRLHGGGYFAGSFAGEHVAATEFVIGALFVSGGASAKDVIFGLLLGNLLAVLSWTLVCAPIAVRTRLTLYWYLRKIGGPAVMVVYNVLNAVLYCVLAGCMITVAASAVRIPFGIEPQTGWLPTDPWFVFVTICVGAAVVLLAILGFKRLAQFASVCSPWMFVMFVAGALVTYPDIADYVGFEKTWSVAQRKVWTGRPPYETMTIVTTEDDQPIETPYVLLEFAEDQELLLQAPAPELTIPIAGGGAPEPAPPREPEGPLAEPTLAKDGDAVVGFCIANKTGDRAFVNADAHVQGHSIIVSNPDVKTPVAVSFGELDRPMTLRLRPQGAEGDGVEVPSFRSYVEDADDVLGFWHIVAFAWICNLAMHLGLSDMALFRYARRSWYGLFSAFGMYLGHYVAWICAGVMGAAVASAVIMNTPLTSLDSGEVAFRALGIAGAVAVVIAGWTTSNPTLYRAGLALQVVTPGWPRWIVTLVAGAITTAIACFPFVFRELLNFVGLYGLLLMPVGAIVVVEHWIFPLIGFKQFWSSRKKQILNWPALLAWGIALAAALYCWHGELIHLFFLAAPVWVLTAGLYIVFAAVAGATGDVPDMEEDKPIGAAVSEPPPAERRPGRLRHYFMGLAVFSLLTILLFSYVIFARFVPKDGTMDILVCKVSFPQYLLVATALYFFSGVIWLLLRERRSPQPAPTSTEEPDEQ
jgi:purine-cytosine permease-like protein